jgi:hypothetical protein
MLRSRTIKSYTYFPLGMHGGSGTPLFVYLWNAYVLDSFSRTLVSNVDQITVYPDLRVPLVPQAKPWIVPLNRPSFITGLYIFHNHVRISKVTCVFWAKLVINLCLVLRSWMRVALPPRPLHGVVLRHKENIASDLCYWMYIALSMFDSALSNNVSTS